MGRHGHPGTREDGFTLIELLVVIIIIGILASIAIPTFLGQRSRANRAALVSDLRNLAARAETYGVDHLGYVGFEGDDEFTTFQASPGVLITNAVTSREDYCIEGTHPRVDGALRYQKTGKPQVGPGTC